MASTNVERAIIAMKADQDSLQARMDDMERKDEHPAGHREAMKEDHMGKDGMERGHKMAQEEYEAPDGPAPEAAMARTKENPKRVPYAQSQTGPFTSPRESDGGSPLNKRHGTAVTAAMQHMSLMAQRAYAADPALTASQREEATAYMAEQRAAMEHGDDDDPMAKMRRKQHAAQEERLANMEQAGATQRAQMGAPAVGVFGQAQGPRTASLAERVSAVEEIVYNTAGTRARMASVAAYAESQGLNPVPYAELERSMSASEIDAMTDAPPQGARTASQRQDRGTFTLTPEMMEELS